MMPTDFNWRNLNVRRARKFEPLIDRFCSTSNQKSLFNYNKDLMVFAAVIGFSKDKYIELPSASDHIPITLGTYSSDRKDSFIYMLALLAKKDALLLKNEHLTKAINIFEGYCNGGLTLIQEWLDSNASDPFGIETIYLKILDEISEGADKLESSMDEIVF